MGHMGFSRVLNTERFEWENDPPRNSPGPQLSAPVSLPALSVQGRPPSLTSTCYGKGHWIDSVIGDGEFILLEDGLLWQVSPLERTDTVLWLAVDDILIVDGNDLMFSCRLVNTSEREVADARRVSD